MTPAQLQQLINTGEGLTIEFKTCQHKLTKDIFPTVCAFLNRNGGHLILGIADDGAVCGVAEEAVVQLKKDFATGMNNPQRINPPVYVALETLKLSGKTVLHTYIPPSSSVHHSNGKIYDRNEDGDFDITNNTLLTAKLYLQKQRSYSENTVYPYIKQSDFQTDLIEKARQLAVRQRHDHPWGSLSDLDLIKSAQLYQQDHQTGQKGFTLAAVLLFGKDNVIRSVVPHYKTDCIKRVVNVDRYDDREIIITNLIESYEKIMAFVEKHLPDPFYLEGTQRISLRDKIFREVISNMLIHREYLNGAPARLIIEPDGVVATNANRPHGFGALSVEDYEPFPKNPNIAAFFREIGRAEELGSGVKNLFKYGKAYMGSDPVLLEQDKFKLELKNPSMSQALAPEDKITQLLAFCETPRSRKEIMAKLGLKDSRHFRVAILTPLLESGKLVSTEPDKPRSPKQKYKSIA